VNASPASRRHIGTGLVAVWVILLSTACAAGQRAQTANEVPAIDATSAIIGTLSLQEVSIKTPPSGVAYNVGDAADLQLAIINTGHAGDTLQSVSSPAASDFAVFANPAEASAAVSASPSGTASTSGSGSASASTSASGSVSSSTSGSSSASASSTSSGSPSSGASASGSTSAGATPVSLAIAAGQLLSFGVTGNDAVLVLHLSKKLFPAATVPITFTFANAGAVTLTVPVQISQHASAPGITIPAPSSSTAG
jgi:copper(I)-binding protein